MTRPYIRTHLRYFWPFWVNVPIQMGLGASVWHKYGWWTVAIYAPILALVGGLCLWSQRIRILRNME